jgi:hypothetical protein
MIAFERIVDLLAGEAGPDADEVEAHLLGCAACSRLADELLATTRAIASAVREGALAFVATRATVERLRREGVAMREYHIAPGQTVACSIGAGERYSLTALELPGELPARVDLVAPTGDRTPDVPVDRSRGVVWLMVRGDTVRGVPTGLYRMRAVGVDGHGGETVLGEYGLDHTAFAG